MRSILAKWEFVRTDFSLSGSRLSRMFSARSSDNSLSSGATCLTPAPLSLPASAALTQLPNACSASPISLATAPTDYPTFTRLFVNFLSLAMYFCFALLIALLSEFMFILRHLWKTIYRGKLKMLA